VLRFASEPSLCRICACLVFALQFECDGAGYKPLAQAWPWLRNLILRHSTRQVYTR